MSIPANLLVHTAAVTPFTGTLAYGESYGEPFTVPCYYEGTRQLVRASDGSEAVSEGILYADLVDIPVGSKVTVLGRDTWALSVATFNDGGLTGLAHVEVALA